MQDLQGSGTTPVELSEASKVVFLDVARIEIVQRDIAPGISQVSFSSLQCAHCRRCLLEHAARERWNGILQDLVDKGWDRRRLITIPLFELVVNDRNRRRMFLVETNGPSCALF